MREKKRKGKGGSKGISSRLNDVFIIHGRETTLKVCKSNKGK